MPPRKYQEEEVPREEPVAETVSTDPAPADPPAKTLEEREAELSQREAALDQREAELTDLAEALKPPATPKSTRKVPTRRFLCVKKCYHWIAADKPETRRIFMPGDEYVAVEGEIVPRHFREITDQSSEKDIRAEAERERMVSLPPHLAKKQATVHG